MPSDGNGRVLSTFALVGQLGFVVLGSILAGFFLGMYLDHLFNSGPVLTIVLLLAGIGGGLVAAYRLVMAATGDEPPHSHQQGGGTP